MTADSRFLGKFMGSGDGKISVLDYELTDAVALGISVTPNNRIYAETVVSFEKEKLPLETELG